ncbi:MAG TPA: hypothetical protein VGX23_08910 [Actinocrinis sp.]|nr:hypothetical protein [Actinocrinis sp.]
MDARRAAQLALAALWLLDGLLQFQPFMFTKDFAAMTLAPVAGGNPTWISGPVGWVAGITQNHPVSVNTAFAVVQVALGVGIAWRPTVKPALLASVVWSAGVWWLGEGLGGLFAGAADPLSGAPGAVLLYALLALLLWPGDRSAPFPAAGRVGPRAARAVWTVLWGLLAVLAVLPANRDAGTVQDIVTGTDDGAPSWFVALENHAGNVTANRGLEFSVALAVLLALVAESVWLPWARAVKAGLVLAFGLAAVIWVFGEGFGMPFEGMATDPNTGPLLALLAFAFWPARRASAATPAGSDGRADRAEHAEHADSDDTEGDAS